MADNPLNASDICNGIGVDLLDFNDEEIKKRYFHSSYRTFLATIGIPLTWLIGVPANLAFLYTIYKVAEMRTITNYYLANLAVADIFCLVLYPLLLVWSFFTSPVTFNFQATSWVQCAAIFFTLDIPYFASNSLVTLVALERFYAICHPLKSRQVRSARRAVALVVTFWLISVAISVTVCFRRVSVLTFCVDWPDSDSNDYDHLPNTVSFCTAGKPWVGIYAHCMYVVFWIVGLFINSVLYFKIIRELGRRTVGRSSSSNEGDVRSRLIRNQVARMLIVNSITFFVLQASRIITINLFSFIGLASGQAIIHPGHASVFSALTYFFSLLNSTVNPIIYNGTNARYRQAFLQAFGFCRRVRAAKQSSLDDKTVSSRVAQMCECNNCGQNMDDIQDSSKVGRECDKSQQSLDVIQDSSNLRRECDKSQQSPDYI